MLHPRITSKVSANRVFKKKKYDGKVGEEDEMNNYILRSVKMHYREKNHIEDLS